MLLAAAIAALNSAPFPDNLTGWLRATVPCDSVVMIAYFQHRPPKILKRHSHCASLHAELDRKYREGAYLLDPFHELHASRAPRGVYRLSDIAPDQFQRNQYFATYYQETTLLDEMVIVTYPSDGVSIHICLGRNANSNTRFSPRNVKDARRIAPIAAVLAETHWSDLDTTGEYQEADVLARLVEAVRERHGVQLTVRQAEVALYTLRGHSALSTGLALGISHQTVKVFRKQLYQRLTISSQGELFNTLLPLLSHEH